jgi:hypothetical protein
VLNERLLCAAKGAAKATVTLQLSGISAAGAVMGLSIRRQICGSRMEISVLHGPGDPTAKATAWMPVCQVHSVAARSLPGACVSAPAVRAVLQAELHELLLQHWGVNTAAVQRFIVAQARQAVAVTDPVQLVAHIEERDEQGSALFPPI